MNKSKYDVRRSMFLLVTLTAVTMVGKALITFVRSSFLHPVRVGGTILGLVAIWSIYLGIVRDLRAPHGEMANNLSTRVETSVGLCCILGYMLSIPALN